MVDDIDLHEEELPAEDIRPRGILEADPVSRTLFTAVLLMVAAVLVALAYLTYFAVRGDQPPRTAVERQEQFYAMAVEDFPESDKAWAEYARALIRTEQYGRARDVLAKAVEAVGSETAFLITERARLEAATGSVEDAVGIAREAIDAGLAEKDRYLADAAERQIRPLVIPASEAIVQAAILTGDLLVESGDHAGAAEAYGVALAEDRRMADVLVARGQAFAESGQNDDAIADFEAALEFIPGYAPAIEGLRDLGVDR